MVEPVMFDGGGSLDGPENSDEIADRLDTLFKNVGGQTMNS